MTTTPQIAPVIGVRTPRLATKPLVDLSDPANSKGYEVIDFAANVLKQPLMPWQEEAAIRAMELKSDGTYRFKTVLVLVARQNGKSHLLRTVALWKMLNDGSNVTTSTEYTVLSVAQKLSVAKEVWLQGVRMAQRSSIGKHIPAKGGVRTSNGEVTLTFDNEARWMIAASNDEAGRGFSVDHLTVDELLKFKGDSGKAAWDAISSTTDARSNHQIWLFSNAGDDQSVVLNRLRDQALADDPDESLCILEWSAEKGADLDDVNAWAQANPALGIRKSMATMQAKRTLLDPSGFRAEQLCIRVDNLDAAVDIEAWHQGADATGSLDNLRDRLVACLDVSPDLEHATLMVAASTLENTTRLVLAGEWTDMDVMRQELPDLLDRIKPTTLGWFPMGPAAAFMADMKSIKKTTEIRQTDVAAACQGFAEQISARKILQPDDPMLNEQMVNAKRLNVGDGWRFTRRGGGYSDAVYAAAGAVHLARLNKRKKLSIILPEAAA